MFGTTDTERVLTSIIILIGDALFAVAFGLMATVAQTQVSNFTNYFEKLKLVMERLNKWNIPQTLSTRLEQYYAYSWSITENLGPVNFEELYKYIPVHMVEKMMCHCNKDLIKNVPLFTSIKSESFMTLLVTKLRPQTYLPHDYLIYQDDIGEEMYFIIEGIVIVLDPDGKKIRTKLTKGNYVGEMALLSSARRVCSVVAATFCFVYILHKQDL